MQVFKSKVDNWLYGVMVLAVLSVSAAPLIAWQRGDQVPGVAWITIVLGLVVGLGLPVWLLLDTHYVIGDGKLRIRCGPLRRTIDLAAIERIEPSRSMLSAPALSLDRLKVSYGRGGSELISPADQAGFLRALAESGVAAAKR